MDDWEIEYCLKEISRKGRTSKTNGVVGVVLKVNGNYDWIKSITNHNDGYTSYSCEKSMLNGIIYNNRINQIPVVYANKIYKTVDSLKGSYIALVDEDTFLKNPTKYIENAYEKSQSSAKGYKITKTRYIND